MKNVLYLLLLLYMPLLFSQSVATTSGKVALNKRLSPMVLEAYQLQTDDKVTDLFYYLNLLTNPTVSDEAKKEVVANIRLLFKNQTVMVPDFTAAKPDMISLQLLTDKLLISEPIVFTVSETRKCSSVSWDSWLSTYKITRQKAGEESVFKIMQTIYMQVQPGLSGQANESWETRLGEMRL